MTTAAIEERAAAVPAPRHTRSDPADAAAPHARRPDLADWLTPHPLAYRPDDGPLYAMPTAWHGDRVVAAICRPGKPDGEVNTGPYRTSLRMCQDAHDSGGGGER
jgi:hypothetical protein